MPLILITHHHYHGDQRSQPAEAPWLHNMLENIMAQIDDLNAELTAIKADVDTIKSGVAAQAEAMAALQEQLTQLQQTTPPQVDLSSAIDAAGAIKSELDSIASGFTPAQPSGGDTTGGDTSGSTPPPSDGSGGTTIGVAGGDTSGSTPPSDGSQSADVTP